TRSIRRNAVELETDERVAAVVRRCELEFGTRSRAVKVFCSETLPIPVAIGHEFIHVARHDYVLNLIYELIFVPISFHPAAALLRRRVKQTRELCCDE